LDRDVEPDLSAGDELDDHLLQTIGRAELGRPDKPGSSRQQSSP
jgi:hypothetical protein